MKDIRDIIKKERLFFDGGTGTVLQSMGLPPGQSPELWNISHPERITELHRSYLDAGANILKTNTFGVNRDKFDNYEELIREGIRCAKKAAEGREKAFVAFDMGPTGQLLEPLGQLGFEAAVDIFAENVRIAKSEGVDLILIETMNDSYETKAAVLAAKENSDLPVFVTNVYDASGKLMTGADPAAMIAMLEGLGVDAVGMNCSIGPDAMLGLTELFARYSSLPIIVNPNAGLPEIRDGETVYNIDAADFSGYMREIALRGGNILGGCCGTDPEFIRMTIEKVSDVPYSPPEKKNFTCVSSYTHAVFVDKSPVLIGERINPTGKKKLKEALRSDDLNYILNEGIRQTDAGVHILDVNVGLPEIDEKEMMKKCVSALQSVTDLPLQIDSTDPETLEGAMRLYNGKPLINSVNGTEESMQRVLPLAAKYGGALIALTIDDAGIPETAQGRADVAEKIIKRAAEYGIDKKDIIVDPLALTVSSNPDGALVTLEAIRLISAMGVKTSLGVSNISFGLPQRDIINSTFYATALQSGLNCAIMNPFSVGMMNVYYSFRALNMMDEGCKDYIGYAADNTASPAVSAPAAEETLFNAVVKGLKESAAERAEKLLESTAPLDIINEHIIPALNEIGSAFEQKKAYLPQLLMSADAATAAFDVVKRGMSSGQAEKRGDVVLATVKGDIHDIGKNIVKVLLESYGFTVYDLGRDVEPQVICDCAVRHNCRLVGLSALMTTTVSSMEETIKLLKETDPSIRVMVGGAVLNQEYADMIGADFYGADAMDTVRYAESFYSR